MRKISILHGVCQGVWREGSSSAEAAGLALGRGEERGPSCGHALVLSPPSTGIFMWAARGRFSAATQNPFFFLLALLINPVAETQSVECTQGLVLCFPCASLAGIRLKMTRAQWEVRCKQLW